MSRFWNWVLGRKPPVNSEAVEEDVEAPEWDSDDYRAQAGLEDADYSAEKSYRRQVGGYEPAELPESRGPLTDPVDDPTEHFTPDPKGRPLSEWEAYRDYFPARMYMAYEASNEDGKGNVRANLRAVDTHTEVTYAYCQANHLHEYHNGKLQTYTRWDQTMKSKHFPAGAPVPNSVTDMSGVFGWTDKTIVETPYCD